MQGKNDRQTEAQPNQNQRTLDQNETVNNPGSNVVDYGRSEQKAAREDRQNQNKDVNTGDNTDQNK